MATAEDDQAVSQILVTLDERISRIEKKIFGDEINSKIQQNRQVIEELIQINGQIHRSLANRASIKQLMASVEEILDLLHLEDSSSSQLLGCENKANAILLSEPIIRRMHGLIKLIDVENVNEAMNSKDIRDIVSLKDELTSLKFQQLDDLDTPSIISSKVEALTEAIDMIITNSII